MNKLVFYDNKNDILSIHKGFLSDEKFKGNVDAGDLILDISTKGKIRGIEIMNASKFFSQFDVGRSMLRNLINANFNASINPTGIILSVTLKTEGAEIPAKIAVPLEMRRNY